MDIIVRKATVSDAVLLSDLGRDTFLRKWSDQTSPANLKKYVEGNYNYLKMAEELANPSIIHVVAEKEGKLVGFARLLFTDPDIQESKPEIEFTYSKSIEISRIYVSSELIGQSIGAILMKKIVDLAKEEHCDLIWLGVWGENPAINFYKRHGFQKAGTHLFTLGDQIDTDWVMVRKV